MLGGMPEVPRWPALWGSPPALWFNRPRNGYRMACKPPWTSTAKARPRFFASACYPPQHGLRERIRGCAGTRPHSSWLVKTALSAPYAPYGRCQRNAVGHVGVKLGAAPDAPPRGQVLVRTPADQLLSARRRAISTSISPSRAFPTCPALAKDPGGEEPRGARPRPRWPASCGGSGHRWQKLARQRALGSTCSRDPYPGKDPL